MWKWLKDEDKAWVVAGIWVAGLFIVPVTFLTILIVVAVLILHHAGVGM